MEESIKTEEEEVTLESLSKRLELLDRKVSFALDLLHHISSNLDYVCRYGNNKR